jgi:thioredoxin
MKKIGIVFTLLATLFLGACSNVNSQNALDAKAFESGIKVETKPQLVDVRTEEEFAGGFIAGAVNWPVGSDAFDKGVATLDKTKPVYVYCLSGGRSGSAAKDLAKLGFTKVYNLKGGTLAWQNAGMNLATTANAPKKEAGLTRAQYDAQIAKGDVIVDFYATWCGPCKKMEPDLAQISAEGKIKVIRIDVDKNPGLAKSFNINEIPIVYAYRDGKQLITLIGYQTKDMLVAPFKQ